MVVTVCIVTKPSTYRPVVPGGAMAQILADQLTLFQPGGAHYAHHINTCTPGFSDCPTALSVYIVHIRYLLRFFDCLAHPNLSATFATDEK